MNKPSKHKNIPGRITATPTGLDVEAQTIVWFGVAYEIPAQSIAVEATDPAHFRLVLTAVNGIILDETPLGEEPEPIEGEVCTLASFDLQPGQSVTEAACFHVAQREFRASVKIGGQDVDVVFDDDGSLFYIYPSFGEGEESNRVRMGGALGRPSEFEPKSKLYTGKVQRREPSPAQVARRAQRAQAAALRAKLGRGDVLTPQEVTAALRAVMGV